MTKTRYVVLVVLAHFCAASSLYAQSGCTDSPEAPTIVLLLVGVAGLFSGSSALKKVLRRGGNR
jgi:XrtJ-associated TM-motif-TM protein